MLDLEMYIFCTSKVKNERGLEEFLKAVQKSLNYCHFLRILILQI